MFQVKTEVNTSRLATSSKVRFRLLFPLPKHAHQLPLDLFNGILSTMNTLESISELARAVRDLIRTGVIVDVQYKPPRCRVQLGGNTTDWLQWLACRAGGARTWWAPSIGEQVVVLSLGASWIPPLCCQLSTPMIFRLRQCHRRHITPAFPMVRSSNTSRKPAR